MEETGHRVAAHPVRFLPSDSGRAKESDLETEVVRGLALATVLFGFGTMVAALAGRLGQRSQLLDIHVRHPTI